MPAHATATLTGDFDVYSGPGTEYYRAADGQARYAGGQARIYGYVGDWALIGYGYGSNLYRIGYVDKSAVPAGESVGPLSLGNAPMTMAREGNLTDDPILSPTDGRMARLPAGTPVVALAYTGDGNHWTYVEVTLDGQPARGFVATSNLQ